MKWAWPTILALGLCATPGSALRAADEQPREFEAQAPIELHGNGPYYQVTLPIEAYFAAHFPDLRDLRVLNARGELLPFSMIRGQSRTEQAVERNRVTLFPLYGIASTPGAVPEIRVERGADGTVVSVTAGGSGDAGGQQLRGYLLDVSQNKHAMHTLELDWDPAATGFQRLSVEASDDLQHWRTWLASAQLARLEFNGERIERNQIELPGGRADYLRLTWREPAVAPTLRSVTLISGTSTDQPAPLAWSAAMPPRRTGESEYEWELPRRLPVERLKIALAQVNVLAPVEVRGRDETRASAQWRLLTTSVLYRLQTGAQEWQQDQISLSGQPIRSIKLKVDTRSGGLGSEMPSLAVGLTPRQVVFLARGDEPFLLAVGNARAKAADLSPATLIPAYNTANAPPISSAALGSMGTMGLGAAAQVGSARDADFPLNWRTAILWAILATGIATIGAMALYLLRQMKV